MCNKKTKKNQINCSICKKLIETNMFGWKLGNNPFPLMKKESDRCCDDCNSLFVLPTRILMMQTSEKDIKKILNKKGWLNNVNGTINMIKNNYLKKQ